MNGSNGCYVECSKTKEDKYCKMSLMWYLKNKTNKSKQKQTHKDREQTNSC